jgi:hypothetical protein
MTPTGRMRHLTTVQGSFHGRVVAARLGAEGILVELRGMAEGPYPLQGAVEVFVGEDQLSLGREILLADAVDAAIDGDLVELDYRSAEWGGRPALQAAELPDVADGFDDVPASDEAGDAALPRRTGRLGAVVALALVIALLVVGVVAVTG